MEVFAAPELRKFSALMAWKLIAAAVEPAPSRSGDWARWPDRNPRKILDMRLRL
jgi:hypothetical protein